MKWEPKFPVDYSSNGDDIDRFIDLSSIECVETKFSVQKSTFRHFTVSMVC